MRAKALAQNIKTRLAEAKHPLVHSVVAGLVEMRRDYQFYKQMRGQTRVVDSHEINTEVQGSYLITSNNGIYRLYGHHIERICSVAAFGIAIQGGTLYVAADHQRYSAILGAPYPNQEALPQGFRPIYTIPTVDASNRIHQICGKDDFIWIANTARNSITKINRHTGAWLAEIAPLADAFGAPLTVGQNHINSVQAFDNAVVLVAFKIGKRALFGVCGRGLLRGYAYRNKGIHDFHIAGENVIFSDSYRFNEEEVEGGILIVDWQPFDPDFFLASPQYFLRGVAGHADEMIIGNSHAGERDERFSGRGRLLIARGEKIVHEAIFPAAQIYDIIRTDGSHFDTPPAIRDFDAICGVFQRNLGDPVLELPLEDALVSEAGKKYDERDLGDVKELQ